MQLMDASDAYVNKIFAYGEIDAEDMTKAVIDRFPDLFFNMKSVSVEPGFYIVEPAESGGFSITQTLSDYPGCKLLTVFKSKGVDTKY